MKTVEELIQEAIDHGIVDQRDDLPYVNSNGNYEDIHGAKLRRWLEKVLKPARETQDRKVLDGFLGTLFKAERDAKNVHYSELPDGVINIVVPPTFLVELTGFTEARQDNTGAITLTDVDGGKRTALPALNIVEMEWVDICDAVEKASLV